MVGQRRWIWGDRPHDKEDEEKCGVYPSGGENRVKVNVTTNTISLRR